MEVDKPKITIQTDADEQKFVEELKNGEYDVDTDCGKIWKAFGDMAMLRKGFKKRKTFFGTLFQTSSFLDAYKTAEGKDSFKEKVKYMLEYNKYPKDSVMYGVDYTEIDENIMYRCDQKIYEVDKNELKKTDMYSLQTKLRNAIMWGNDWSDGKANEIQWKSNLLPRINCEINPFDQLCVACPFWIGTGARNENEKIKKEFVNATCVHLKPKLTISDGLVKNEEMKNTRHTPLSYFNYLYNKYVLTLNKDTLNKLNTVCTGTKKRVNECNIDIEELINSFKNEYKTIKDYYFYPCIK